MGRGLRRDICGWHDRARLLAGNSKDGRECITTPFNGLEPAVQVCLCSLRSGGWLPPLMVVVKVTTISKDFGGALKTAGLADFFAGCTNAHKNEYLKWIAEAKRPETRQARTTKAMRMLSNKRAEEDARARKK